MTPGICGQLGPAAGAAGPRRVTLTGMRWRVGVLRSGVENISWTEHGAGPDWASARGDALAALYALAQREGPQELRIQVGDREAYVHPGLTEDGALELSTLASVLLHQYWPA